MKPGQKTFVDTAVFHSGRASLRIENFGAAKADAAGIAQRLLVALLDLAREFGAGNSSASGAGDSCDAVPVLSRERMD